MHKFMYTYTIVI